MTTLDSKSKKTKQKAKKKKKPTFLNIFRGIQVEAGFEEDT